MAKKKEFQLLNENERLLILKKLNHKNHSNPENIRSRLRLKLKDIDNIIKEFFSDIEFITEFLGKTSEKSNIVYENLALNIFLNPYITQEIEKKNQEVKKIISNESFDINSLNFKNDENKELYNKFKELHHLIKINKNYKKIVDVLKKEKKISKGILLRYKVKWSSQISKFLNIYTEKGIFNKKETLYETIWEATKLGAQALYLFKILDSQGLN
jgi:hypothetical protein